MSVFTKAVVAGLPYVPKPIMRRMAARYIAGERLEDALARLESLRARGYPGILDVLGEGITSVDEARAVCATYKTAASAIRARGWDVYVSVKPTHLALTKDEALCRELYADLVRHCAKLELFVRVEMEDATTTDATLRVFESLRKEFTNVGIVLQARLFRTQQDIAKLAPGALDVRLVKGIYLEPAEIAHTEPEPIRVAFLECLELLVARRASVSLATHDDGMAERSLAILRAANVPKERYEFQVLLGVREPLWEQWKSAGHRVRVYVPYGPDWRAYSIRRMRKNPQIVGHVLRSMFR